MFSKRTDVTGPLRPGDCVASAKLPSDSKVKAKRAHSPNRAEQRRKVVINGVPFSAEVDY